MKKRFISIRSKLIRNTMLIISIIFILVLSVITIMNVQNADKNIKKSEHNIRSSLIAKGKTLASNNAFAMSGMAEDYAFTAIQDLVSSTVKDDPDIEYGIYMDSNQVAWVNASSENPSGRVMSRDPFTDRVSKWAASLETLNHQMITFGNQEIIEFAAPVFADDEILGFIRYGISTRSMRESLEEARENGIRTRNQAVKILLFIGIISLAVTYLVIRRLATEITRPIGSLVQSANAISEGNYNVRIQSESNDEIGNLAEHFETMRTTVKRYTDHLQDLVDEKMQQVNDILNNIDQGLFTLNLDGSVNKEYSSRANEILRVKDIASCSLNEILRLDAKQENAFNMWLNVIQKRHNKQRWKKLARLAPIHELELNNPADTDIIPDYVSIAYQKVYDKQGQLSKIMILAMDETEKRMKELQMKEERQKHESEMKIILGLVNTPPGELSEFIEDTNERMERVRQSVEDHLTGTRKQREKHPDSPAYDITGEEINSLYRDIHTIKGNSGSYGFEMLSAHAHNAEDALEKLREPVKMRRDSVLEEMITHLDRLNGDIDQIHSKIKLIFGKDERATMRIPKSHVQHIINTCAAIDRSIQSGQVNGLIDKCIMLSWTPIETITRKYQKIVGRVARWQKKNIRFIVKPEHVFFPSDIFSDIDDALLHLIRNAADHGIEPPEVREELGKGIGQVTFEFKEEDNARTVIVSDDGKGIDTRKLTEICIGKGFITREEAENLGEKERLNLVFMPGLSTSDKITDISGRGVGMDVVRERFEMVGGTVSIDSTVESGTKITLALPGKGDGSISPRYSVFEEVKDSLTQSAVECVMSLFDKQVEVREPWKSDDQLEGLYDHVLYVTSMNRQFQGVTVVGIQTDHIEAFIDESDIEMMIDALGEFTNTYTGLVMDDPRFRDSFDILKAFPPSYRKDCQLSFPRMRGISGKLFQDDKWIYIGFAIRNRTEWELTDMEE
ncbi:ATP-binding protein [Desulfococcaceae bacterium HSG8]|nr:ATP-binding protein [Desulfococcaceae bacterium HSG8]